MSLCLSCQVSALTFWHIQPSDAVGRGHKISKSAFMLAGSKHKHWQRTHQLWPLTSSRYECEIALMSASEAHIRVSLSPEPSADNYSRPFSRPESHQSCRSAQLKSEELSLQPSQKRSKPRSGPMFNFAFDSSPPFFLLQHLSTPPSWPAHAVAVEFHSRPNLYFQDNQRLDTHSFPILQSSRLNGN